MEPSALSTEVEWEPTIVPGDDAVFTDMVGEALPRLAGGGNRVGLVAWRT